MTRNFLIALTVLLTSLGFAQNTKDVGTFNRVSVYDQIILTLEESDDPSNTIVISGNKADQVNVINKNGHVKIKMNLANSYQGDQIKITLYHHGVDHILAAEGAVVKSKQPLTATALDLQAKTGGLISLDIQTQRVNINSGAGAVVKLTGSATVQDIVSNSGAEVQNKNLVTSQTTVTVNAGGIASVNASELVDAKTRAGGNIYIYGDPKVINQKNVAGGVIKKVK
ncbi:GIN domain-containing protein [Myroides sp. LJL119]